MTDKSNAFMQRSREAIADDFRTLTNDVEQLLKTTASYSGEGLSALRSRVGDGMNNLKASLMETESMAMDKYSELADFTQSYVREKPLRSVGLAVGAGILIGWLLLGSSSKR